MRLPLRQLGEALRARGKLDDSIALLRRTRALEAKLFGTEDHPSLADTLLQLACSLAATNEQTAKQEAARLLDSSIDLFRRHRPSSGGLGEALPRTRPAPTGGRSGRRPRRPG